MFNILYNLKKFLMKSRAFLIFKKVARICFYTFYNSLNRRIMRALINFDFIIPTMLLHFRWQYVTNIMRFHFPHVSHVDERASSLIHYDTCRD